MGVLEDVVVNAKSAAETVGKEAGRLVDLSKLRFTASDIQRDISKKYETLGKMVYEARKKGGSADAGLDEVIRQIDTLYQKLDEVNSRINALSRKSVCPSCGYKNDDKAVFCSRCGTRLSQDTEQNDIPAEEYSSPDQSSEENDSDNDYSEEE